MVLTIVRAAEPAHHHVAGGSLERVESFTWSERSSAVSSSKVNATASSADSANVRPSVPTSVVRGSTANRSPAATAPRRGMNRRARITSRPEVIPMQSTLGRRSVTGEYPIRSNHRCIAAYQPIWTASTDCTVRHRPGQSRVAATTVAASSYQMLGTHRKAPPMRAATSPTTTASRR